MININLLPWRDDVRLQQKQKFFSLLVAATVFALCIIAGNHWVVSHKIALQEQRNNFLKKNIAAFSTEIDGLKVLQKEKQQLLENLSLIQDLHDSKFRVVRMLDEVVRLVPKNVHLTKILRTDTGVYFEGTAKSNEKITRLMKNISRSKWLNDPELKEIEVDAKTPSQKHFKLVTKEVTTSTPSLGVTKTEEHHS